MTPRNILSNHLATRANSREFYALDLAELKGMDSAAADFQDQPTQPE